MAETEGSQLQTEDPQGVCVPALRPRDGTRLLSPPVPGLGLGEQDALGLSVSVTDSSWPLLTRLGNRCLASAEPKEETQSLPSELPGYRRDGHILKTRK